MATDAKSKSEGNKPQTRSVPVDIPIPAHLAIRYHQAKKARFEESYYPVINTYLARIFMRYDCYLLGAQYLLRARPIAALGAPLPPEAPGPAGAVRERRLQDRAQSNAAEPATSNADQSLPRWFPTPLNSAEAARGRSSARTAAENSPAAASFVPAGQPSRRNKSQNASEPDTNIFSIPSTSAGRMTRSKSRTPALVPDSLIPSSSSTTQLLVPPTPVPEAIASFLRSVALPERSSQRPLKRGQLPPHWMVSLSPNDEPVRTRPTNLASPVLMTLAARLPTTSQHATSAHLEDAQTALEDLVLGPNESRDSHSAPVTSRNVPGHEQNIFKPDFVVVKTGEQPNKLDLLPTWIVTIVEVKKDEEKAQHKKQLQDYICRSLEKTWVKNCPPHGYLIAGDNVTRLELQSNGVTFSETHFTTTQTGDGIVKLLAEWKDLARRCAGDT